MNRKGFTMIELLAVIVILGVISFIVVAAVIKYIGSSRSKSFVMMSQSVYEATEYCILHNQLPQCHTGGTVKIKEDLYDNRYIDKLTNPVKSTTKTRDVNGNYIENSNICNGTVKIQDTGYVDNQITTYKYTVDLNCPGYRHATIVWPNTKSMNELMGCEGTTCQE